MHWIHLISIIALTGTVFSVRYLVLPSLGVLTAEQSTVLMGKLMPEVRRTMRVGIFLLFTTEVYLFASRTATDVVSWRLLVELVITLVLTLVVLALCVSPHRNLALRIEPKRARLLDVTLALLIALTAVSHFE